MSVNASRTIAKIFVAKDLNGLIKHKNKRQISEKKIFKIVCPIPLLKEKYIKIIKAILAQYP